MTDWINTFGYKMAWLTIKNTNPKTIIQTLGLPNAQIISWDEGIDKIYEDYGSTKNIFIASQINNWSFVVGWYFLEMNSQNTGNLEKFKKYIAQLSNVFEEVQAFATHRVSEYHLWARAKEGKIKRFFVYPGSSEEFQYNEGKLTDAEKQLPWDKLKSYQWFPDESDVMNIAKKWSMDPNTITSADIKNIKCYIVNPDFKLSSLHKVVIT